MRISLQKVERPTDLDLGFKLHTESAQKKLVGSILFGKWVEPCLSLCMLESGIAKYSD